MLGKERLHADEAHGIVELFDILAVQPVLAVTQRPVPVSVEVDKLNIAEGGYALLPLPVMGSSAPVLGVTIYDLEAVATHIIFGNSFHRVIVQIVFGGAP